MNVIQQQLQSILETRLFSDSKIFVAFSGGVDSLVLLHGVRQVTKILSRPLESVIAVHVHHGLQAEADDWLIFCQEQASAFNVRFLSRKVDIDAASGNLEAKARDQRYSFFSEMIASHDLLVTAHHQDDQAETLLLNLLRGSGIDGLAGMPSVTPFHHGVLLRPLLSFSKEDIYQYAKSHKLTWITDPSNKDDHFNRNFLRNQVIPLLRTRWPEVSSLIARSAQNCREINEIILQQSDHDLSSTVGLHRHSLSIKKLSLLSIEKQHLVLRAWIKSLNFPMPDRKKIEFIASEFILMRKDARPLLEWSTVQLHRFNGYLYLVKKISLTLKPSISLVKQDLLTGNVVISDGDSDPSGCLQLSYHDQEGQRLDHDLVIHFRVGGEAYRLQNRAGKKKLKKLFQEWKIPPWMRNFVPLLYINDECIAIADYAWCESQYSSLFEHFIWEPNPDYDWRKNP